MFQKRLLLLLLACSFSSLCKCFFLSKMYNTIVRKEAGVKTSCDGPSSLKTQTSVLYPLKTKYSSNSLKKKFFFILHLPLSPEKCLKGLHQEILTRLHSYKRKANPTYPLPLLLLLPTAARQGRLLFQMPISSRPFKNNLNSVIPLTPCKYWRDRSHVSLL